jgi:hypothetical protein
VDNKGAEDELRARRAFQAGQRAERERDAALAARQAAVTADLRAAAVALIAEKQQRLAEEVELDKAEFARARAVQEEWVAAEAASAAARRAADRGHTLALAAQKEETERARRAEVASAGREGAAARAALEAELARLSALRDARVAELRAAGLPVPGSLAAYDPADAIKHDYKRGRQSTARGAGTAAGTKAAAAGATTTPAVAARKSST